jgi:hypothetical protein
MALKRCRCGEDAGRLFGPENCEPLPQGSVAENYDSRVCKMSATVLHVVVVQGFVKCQRQYYMLWWFRAL